MNRAHGGTGMIVLASSNADILRRWSGGVPAGAVLAHDQAELERTLGGRRRTWFCWIWTWPV